MQWTSLVFTEVTHNNTSIINTLSVVCITKPHATYTIPPELQGEHHMLMFQSTADQ